MSRAITPSRSWTAHWHKLPNEIYFMNSLFWERAHGGLTHLPIALIFGAAFFDALAFFCRRSEKRSEFKAIGYWLVIMGGIGSFGAVFSGVVLSKGTMAGSGAVLRHHYFVWPAFTLIV